MTARQVTNKSPADLDPKQRERRREARDLLAIGIVLAVAFGAAYGRALGYY